MQVTVSVCQLAADVDRPGQVAALEAAVREAAAAEADLVVLPELALAGSCFLSPELARAAAEDREGSTVALLRALSSELGLVVVCGFPERADDAVYNAAVIVDRGDVLGFYRKVHLWGSEPVAFTPAADPPLVVDTSAGRVAVMICYDLEIPEWVRLAAQAGADMVAVPANWPRNARTGDRPAIEVVKAQAASAYYSVHVLVADRCGVERGVEWEGASLISAPDGALIVGPATAPGGTAAPTVLTARLDLAASRDKRLGARNHVWADRRPELYRDPDAV